MRLRHFGILTAYLPIACSVAPQQPPPMMMPVDEFAVPPQACRTPAPSDMWFSEITADVGLAKTDSLEPLGVGIVAADVDEDGWQDFFSSSTAIKSDKQTSFLFMNRPDPNDPSKRIFVDALADSGLLARRSGNGDRQISGVTFGDLDNDGHIDAIGCAGDIDSRIVDSCAAFLGDGHGHFKLAPEGGDLEANVYSSGGGALLDFDSDGILDFWPNTIGKWQYCPSGGAPMCPAPESHMRFYKGAGDGTFTEITSSVGIPTTSTGPGDYRMIFGVTSCDVDLDGDRDVLLAEYGQPIGQNHLFRNDGGTFADVGKTLGVWKGPGATLSSGGGFTFGIACGDIDDDGDVDLFTAELRHAWVTDGDFSELLRNDTPPGQPLAPYVRPGRAATGFDRPHIGMAWTEGDSQVSMADLDLDGRKDVYITSVNYPQQYATDPDWTHDWVYRQKPDGTFEDVTTKTPFWDMGLQSLGNVALADIDNDGDLDVITGTATYNAEYLGLHNAIHVFRNDVGQSSNMIRLALTGKDGTNKSAIGARVELKAGGRTQYQEVLGGQSSLTLTFGTGSACAIDEIVVHWPDADQTVTHHPNVPANYLVEITQGDKPRYRTLDAKKIAPK